MTETRISSTFVKLLQSSNNDKDNNNESFIMCPKIFFKDISDEERKSMQQLYQVAYENAVARINEKRGESLSKDEFFMGLGI